MSGLGDGTRVVRAGLPEAEQGEPVPARARVRGSVSPAAARSTAPTGSTRATATRPGRATRRRWASSSAAEVVIFSSGMAAATALLLTSLEPGTAVAMDHACYQGVRKLAEGHLAPRGVEVRLAPPAELESAVQGAQLLWLESPVEPAPGGLRPGGAGRGGARGGRALRRRQHDGRAALPEPARPRRRLRADERDQAPVRARRPDARVRRHARRRARAGAARLAHRGRRDAGSVRGLARAPLAGDAGAAARARQRQRARAGRVPVGPRRRLRRALPGPARRPGARGGAPPDERVRDGRLLRRRQPRARRALPRRLRARHRGVELRRRADERRAAPALGRRRRGRGLHPPVGRLRGRGRPGGGRRSARSTRRDACSSLGGSGYLGRELLVAALGRGRACRRATSDIRDAAAVDALFARCARRP